MNTQPLFFENFVLNPCLTYVERLNINIFSSLLLTDGLLDVNIFHFSLFLVVCKANHSVKLVTSFLVGIFAPFQIKRQRSLSVCALVGLLLFSPHFLVSSVIKLILIFFSFNPDILNSLFFFIFCPPSNSFGDCFVFAFHRYLPLPSFPFALIRCPFCFRALSQFRTTIVLPFKQAWNRYCHMFCKQSSLRFRLKLDESPMVPPMLCL